MEKKKRKIEIKQVFLRGLVFILLSCLLGGIVETCFNAKLLFLNKEQKGITSLALSNAKLTGARYENGHIVIQDPNAKIVFSIPKTYINKISMEFNTKKKDFTSKLNFSTYDLYGRSGVQAAIQANVPEGTERYNASKEFKYTAKTNRGTIHLGKNVDEISVEIPDEAGQIISAVKVINNPQFNVIRYGFFTAVFMLAIFLFFHRNTIGKKPEVAFIVASLILGSVMIVAAPVHSVSWDEHIHYYEAYTLGRSDTAPVGQSTNEMMNALVLPQQSIEDRKDAIFYLNSNASKASELADQGEFVSGIQSVGYITQTIMLRIFDAAGSPFYTSFLAGKMGNLLLYSIVLFFAIKYLVKGKMILTMLALMPTPLFLASTYAYDPTVFAFLMLGFSVILSELMQPNKQLSAKSAMIFCVSTIIGCSPKATYIPFILLALLLPQSKFKSKKLMYIFKGIIVAVCLIMLGTFALPFLSTTNPVGDARGGATNGKEQVKLILSHPIAYTKLLVRDCIFSKLGTYTSYEALTSFAYSGASSLRYLPPALIAFVVLTDTHNYSSKIQTGIKPLHKVSFATLSFITACLIWTALYLSFTPVGLGQINGVQLRYYIPLLFPIFLLFNTPKITNTFKKRNYNTGIIAMTSFITLYTVYELMIKATVF